MTTISAADVKKLREMTGAGMMDCKKALQETQGDFDAAIDYLRKHGQAKAAKRAGRIAAEGVIALAISNDGKSAFMAEINSETDFVARDATFRKFVDEAAKVGLAKQTAQLEKFLEAPLDDKQSVEQARQTLVQTIGENVNVRRIEFMSTQGVLGAYLHGDRIGVLVELTGGTMDVAKDVAMHVAATNPFALDQNSLDPALIAKEREILKEQAKDSGKPENIIEKMVDGRISKFVKDVCLVEQPFVKDPEITIANLLKKHNAKVVAFKRFEVGEGIEKEVVDFAEEVKAQVQGS